MSGKKYKEALAKICAEPDPLFGKICLCDPLHPHQYCPTHTVGKNLVAVALGKLGGASKSAKKQAASRKEGD